MIYLADNLAYFPYTMQDEPLYIIHQIDLLITVAGTSLLQTFKENLKPVPGQEQNDPNARKFRNQNFHCFFTEYLIEILLKMEDSNN